MWIAGIDIGGTKCTVILGETGREGQLTVAGRKITGTREFPDPCLLIRKMQMDLDVLLEENSLTAEELASIGISCGGPLDSKQGLVLSPPNLPGWDRIPVVRLFSEKYGIPVAVQNDANACALAEWKFGAGRGTRNMVFLTFGTGMGAGLILDGRLYTGTNDNAGEVGHIRLADFGPVGYGKAGSFEGFCSGGGIAQLARMKAFEKLQMGIPAGYCPSYDSLESITARDVALAAAGGDPLAREVYRLSGEFLGKGLSVLIDILNPEMIVIGSIFERSGSLLRESMERTLEREVLPLSGKVCRVVPAELGDTIGDYASLSVAVYEIANPQK